MFCIFLLTGYAVLIEGGSEYRDSKLVLSMFVGAVAFGYVALAGYMPKFLLHLFSRGPVASNRDLK